MHTSPLLIKSETMTVEIISSKALRLPLIGSRDTNELFEYLLIKMNDHGALVSVPNWVINRVTLTENEVVSLHLKHFLGTAKPVLGRAFSSGTHWNGYENLYRIQFTHPLIYTPLMPGNRSIRDELIFLVKDSFFLKNGIFVILKHLIPYFSRLLKLTQEHYKNLKTALLDEVLRNVQENMRELEHLWKLLDEQITDERDIPLYLNLETLRRLIQSEIDFSLFIVAFDQSKGKKKLNQIFQTQTYSLKSHTLYLDAIKVTEHRLYDNYNTIVSLFSRSYGR